MNIKLLQSRRAFRAILFVLLLCAMGMTKMHIQKSKRVSSYTDHGIAIGTYDAVNDQWIPSGGRIENAKTGFGSIAWYSHLSISVRKSAATL